MTSFFLTFLFYRHPGAGRDPLHRRYLCRIRDGINYLGPVVKPRDDKKGELCSAGPGPRDDTREQSSKFKEQSSNVMSRCDKFYYLGPVVKPRDDKKWELCSAGPGPRDDTREQSSKCKEQSAKSKVQMWCRCATSFITWVPVSSTGMTSFFLTFLFS